MPQDPQELPKFALQPLEELGFNSRVLILDNTSRQTGIHFAPLYKLMQSDHKYLLQSKGVDTQVNWAKLMNPQDPPANSVDTKEINQLILDVEASLQDMGMTTEDNDHFVIDRIPASNAARILPMLNLQYSLRNDGSSVPLDKSLISPDESYTSGILRQVYTALNNQLDS